MQVQIKKVRKFLLDFLINLKIITLGLVGLIIIIFVAFYAINLLVNSPMLGVPVILIGFALLVTIEEL